MVALTLFKNFEGARERFGATVRSDVGADFSSEFGQRMNGLPPTRILGFPEPPEEAREKFKRPLVRVERRRRNREQLRLRGV